MGTDIHLAVERREPQGWVIEATEDDNWYDGRNYNLFAILADVRNGRGFAGCDTGDPVIPIAEQRGIPSDASLDVRVWAADEDSACWGHSASWLTARELVSVDWLNNKLVHRGWVNPENFYRFDKWKKPEEWSGGVDGPQIEKVSNTEMLRRIQDLEVCTSWTRRAYEEKNGQLPPPGWAGGFSSNVYTQIEWTETWGSAVYNFSHTILAMVRVAALHKLSLDDVRAVFFFDS